MIRAILGPTAAGKSDVAMLLALRLGGAIVSVDSMQVYRGMDIGTAKPGAAERARVPHYMIDVADPEDDYTVADFQRAGRAVLEERSARGAGTWIVGGSGLHFRALVDPLEFPPTDPALRERLEAAEPGDLAARLVALDPDAGNHVDLANPRRVIRAVEIHQLTGDTPSARARRPEAVAVREYRPAVPVRAVGFDPGDGLADRVATRGNRMLEEGLLAEVAGLAPRLGATARQAVGYKELLPVVAGDLDVETGRDRVVAATLALAKRQRTFFRRDPRIRWLPWSEDPEVRARSAAAAFEEEPSWTS